MTKLSPDKSREMTSETRGGRSRKHKLSCYRGDSQDITSDGTCSNRAYNSWEDSDDINSYFCQQLSTLSIPKGQPFDHPPRKKLKRRKNRKVKRSRVTRPTVNISESSDVTPASPASSNMKSVASDDTIQEAMAVGGYSTDSSLSLGHITDLGGTDADDELSCWEGPHCNIISDQEDMDLTECSDPLDKRKVVRIDTALNTTGILPEVRVPHACLAKREKLKTRHRSATKEPSHEGSSTSSPSMTGIDSVIKRRFIIPECIQVTDNNGNTNAMLTGD